MRINYMPRFEVDVTYDRLHRPGSESFLLLSGQEPLLDVIVFKKPNEDAQLQLRADREGELVLETSTSPCSQSAANLFMEVRV